MGERTADEEKLTFVSFCIEEYKTLNSLNGAAVAERFEKYGVTDYLLEHFEVLHTLGKAAIMDDISRFIEERTTKR